MIVRNNMNQKIIISMTMALILLVPGSVLMTPTNVAAQDDTKLLVINGGVHDLNLKATMQSDGSVNTEKDFAIDAEDVVQTDKDTLMVVTTAGIIDKVKVVNAALQTIELTALPSNYFGIENLPAGAYLLDIIVLKSNGDKLAYETVLIILAEGQPVLTQTQVTNIVKTIIKIDTKIIFREPKNDTKPIVNNTNPIGNETDTEPSDNATESQLQPHVRDNETVEDPTPILSPEPTDQCYPLGVGEDLTDCPETEEEEKTANCGGEPCTPDQKEDYTTDPRDEEDSEQPEEFLGDGENEVNLEEESEEVEEENSADEESSEEGPMFG